MQQSPVVLEFVFEKNLVSEIACKITVSTSIVQEKNILLCPQTKSRRF